MTQETPDRRRGDDLDVDAGLGERVEHVGRDARMALHSRADERDLRDLRVAHDAGRPDLARGLLEDRLRGRQVRLRHRERDARRPLLGDVLDDHVDVHAGVRERAEDACRDPGPVGDAEDHDLRLRGVVRDPRR
jgi:hypothetical protein